MTRRSIRPRLFLLDGLRGLCVLSMVLYHAMYDYVHILGHPLSWYTGIPGHLWQQSICWTFILLSGFCWEFSRHPVQRGLFLVGCGSLITVVTWLVMPSELIFFGILTLLGLSALLLNLFQEICKKCRLSPSPTVGFFLCLGLFFVTRDVPQGFLGFEGLRFLELPAQLYRYNAFALFGFPSSTFYSSDYFPLIPWSFLYFAGHFLQELLLDREPVGTFLRRNPPFLFPFCRIGRHSFLIYLLHQPILMGIFQLFQGT